MVASMDSAHEIYLAERGLAKNELDRVVSSGGAIGATDAIGAIISLWPFAAIIGGIYLFMKGIKAISDINKEEAHDDAMREEEKAHKGVMHALELEERCLELQQKAKAGGGTLSSNYRSLCPNNVPPSGESPKNPR